MTDKEFIDIMVNFSKAQKEAEKAGMKNFECPLCGGQAYWGRAVRVNNHLYCGCNGCGIRIQE